MGFNSKSDYALNKKSKDIVYRFAATVGGKSDVPEVITVSADDFVKVKIKGFSSLKTISDDDYHDTELSDKREDRQTVCLHPIEGTDLCSTESLEDEYFRHLDEQEQLSDRTLENALDIIENCLTGIQQRRFYQLVLAVAFAAHMLFQRAPARRRIA